MKEVVEVIRECINHTVCFFRAANVGFIVLYYLLKIVLIGDNDENIIKIINALSKRSPLYVKIFQSLAGSSGVLSQNVQAFIAMFSDNVPYTDDDERYDYLQQQLSYISKNNPELTITDLSETPIHSGTISLVYTGKIGKQPIVVKCVRDGVREKMYRAISEAHFVVSILNIIPSIKNMNLGCILRENKQLLFNQMSMKHELTNLIQIHNNFKNRDYIIIPEPYSKFTEENDDILVMTQIKGKRVDEVKDDEKEEYGVLLAKQSIDAILTDGVYHGDLHMGNILFIDDDGFKKIGMLDFGIMGHLSESEQLILSSFYLSLGMGDYEDVVSCLIGTLTNSDILKHMEKSFSNKIFHELVTLTENACTSKEGFGVQHMREINDIFAKYNLQMAPIFCRLELALAMNVCVSKALETKNKNFMGYLQDVIKSKMDITAYDV